VIGGLITSTFLSLLYIPVVFVFMDQVKNWFGRILDRRFAGQKVQPQHAQIVAGGREL